MQFKVNLTYFKKSGKYYSEESYIYEAEPQPLGVWEKGLPGEGIALFDIWNDVVNKFRNNDPPGLISWHNEFITLVEVPDHPHAHPHLIMPTERTERLKP